MKITVYMMHGYHWDISGTISRPFVTKEEAVEAAASLVNLLRVDCQDLYEDEDDILEPATADNWEEILRGVRRLRSECNVQISPVDMEVPVNWVYADRLYDALMENYHAWHGEEESVKDEHAELIKNNSDLILEIETAHPLPAMDWTDHVGDAVASVQAARALIDIDEGCDGYEMLGDALDILQAVQP